MADKSIILKEAQKYLARGQIDKAILEWEKLVKEAPDGNTFNTIGDLYLKKGNKKSALDFFHKAAGFFRGEGFSLKALALYRKIINIEPSDAGALTALGELSEEKGLGTDAIKYYLTAADILSKESSKERFLNIYEKILALAPANIPLRDKVAGLFLKEGFPSHAIKEYIHIARFFADKEEPDQASLYFMKVLNIQRDNKNALVGLSQLFEKKGDLRQAVEYMEKAIDLHRDDRHLLMRCASLLKAVEDYDGALDRLSKAAELQPSDAEVNRGIGDIHLLRGDRERAWESYKAVIDSLIDEDKVEDAIETARQLKDINPVETGKLLISLYRQKDDMDAVFEETVFVADLLLEGGLQAEALDFYREALKIRPDDIQVKRTLAEQEVSIGAESLIEAEKSDEDLLTDADIFIKYGLYDEALSILDELKVKASDNIDVHTKLKSLYLDMNDREQAVTECLILYELYGRSGNDELREGILKDALAINPEDPRLLERVSASGEEPGLEQEELPSESLDDYVEEVAEAEFYLRQGLREDALRIYDRLLRIFPDNEDLRSKQMSLQGGLSEYAVGDERIPPGEDRLPGADMPSSPEAETFEAHEIHEAAEPQFDKDVLDIFEEFKKGLEKELDAEDSETHYNLGIAYKEMGLIDDAIKEFQTSRSDPKFAVQSLTMLGLSFMEKGLFPLAINSFKEALESITARDESYRGAQYDLASAYEKNNDLQEAFDIFSEIYGWNSKFRQVAERLDHLKPHVSRNETPAKTKEKKDRVSYI